ncbi:unnamed protein product [Caenorhabditis sp. 36 PRJEB53466]|nr:unnamed protein product [Caenorhabditis sp. 36 PRJEB53466]
MFLLRSLLLLLLLGRIADFFKLGNTLKKVGKRFQLLSDDMLGEVDISHLKETEYAKATPEQVKRIKQDHAVLMNILIRGQASSANPGWQKFREHLTMVLDKELTADVCGVTQLNYVQFVDFLAKDRVRWKKMLTKDESKFVVLENNRRDVIRMRMSFKQESVLGYFSTQIYYIDMKATYPNIETEKDLYFTATSISVKGGCTEYGEMDANNTQVNELDTEIWNNVEAKKFLMLFTPVPYQGLWQDPTKIPTLWLSGLEIDKYLTATVCDPKSDTPRRYSEAEFRRWYELFGRMWRPKKNNMDFVTIREIERTEDLIIARITFRLVIGLDWDGNAREVDWDFKIKAEYHKHGNKKWLVSSLDVHCPPALNLMEASYEAYRNITGLTLVSMIPLTKRVYQDLGFLQYLTKNDSNIELDNCGGETLDSINEIEKKFWAPGSNYSATFLEHVAMDTEEGLAKEDTYFTMYVGLGTYEEMATETEGGTESQGDKFTSLEATWKFYILWDPVDLFYYIKKIEFGCPKVQSVRREFEWPENTMTWTVIGG